MRARQVLTDDLIQSSHYAHGKVEAQRREETCPRSHSKLEDVGLEPMSLFLRPKLSPLRTLVTL